MKKVTAISLENYRAFHGTYDVINLPNGENVLIYGENGSGKSSLFKALYDYFQSSRLRNTPFIYNRYDSQSPGKIQIEFSDFTGLPVQLVPNSSQLFSFGTAVTDNIQTFIQSASLIKGFLEYRDLLKVYFHKEAIPNLFDLIISSLLNNYIPIAAGASYRLGQKWDELQTALLNSYNRNDSTHRNALNELPNYEVALRATLDSVFIELNRLLGQYFGNLKLSLSYNLQALNFNYTRQKKDWHTTADLRLIISKDGVAISGDYQDFLNEARLSAFSVCLFLASLRLNPVTDLQVLYLDDIFIGLDTGNRLPILKIVENEFPNHQIFISTYDRHWYELAKRYFEIHQPGKWKNLELYVSEGTQNTITFDKPLVLSGSTSYEKAVQYLHNRSSPDYPAAASYFRKYLEEIINEHVPTFELVGDDFARLPDYALTKLLEKTSSFFIKISQPVTTLNTIISLLHALIHPLSHFVISTPIYKRELEEIQFALLRFKTELSSINKEIYRPVLDSTKKVRITIIVNSQTNHIYTYELSLKSALVIRKNSDGTLTLLETPCVLREMSGVNAGKKLNSHRPKTSNQNYNYSSVKNAYNSIYKYLQSTESNLEQPIGFSLNYVEWLNIQHWEPLSNLVIWQGTAPQSLSPVP